MAKTATLAATSADAAAAPARKKKSKLMLVLMMLVLLGAAGGGAAWWFLGRAHVEPDAKAAPIKPPLFHTLEPFTVNLAEENGDHYLQVSVVYQVTDDKAVDQVKIYLPVIRNRILLLLSAKRPSELPEPCVCVRQQSPTEPATRSLPTETRARVAGAARRPRRGELLTPLPRRRRCPPGDLGQHVQHRLG